MTTLPTLTKKSLQEGIEHRTKGRPFSLHHTDVTPGCRSALYLHCHFEHEFLLLTKGELYFYIEDRQYHLSAGDMIFIPGGLIHYATRAQNEKTVCSFDAIVFSPHLLLDTLPPYCEHYLSPALCRTPASACHLTSASEWQKEVLFHVSSIFQYQDTPMEDCELLIRGAMLMAWQHLYNNWLAKQTKKHRTASAHPLLEECIEQMNQNYMDTFSLAELASHAGLSEGHFCRVFKEITGFTPFHYMNRVRITKACELLTRTHQKIADISTSCGFNNISYFNRTFKEIMKESPSAYRKNFHNM